MSNDFFELFVWPAIYGLTGMCGGFFIAATYYKFKFSELTCADNHIVDRVINLESKVAKLIELLYASEKILDEELERHRNEKAAACAAAQVVKQGEQK